MTWFLLQLTYHLFPYSVSYNFQNLSNTDVRKEQKPNQKRGMDGLESTLYDDVGVREDNWIISENTN